MPPGCVLERCLRRPILRSICNSLYCIIRRPLGLCFSVFKFCVCVCMKSNVPLASRTTQARNKNKKVYLFDELYPHTRVTGFVRVRRRLDEHSGVGSQLYPTDGSIKAEQPHQQMHGHGDDHSQSMGGWFDWAIRTHPHAQMRASPSNIIQ
jgi:hypothetical protein